MAGRQVQVNQHFEDHGSREDGLLTRAEMVLERFTDENRDGSRNGLLTRTEMVLETVY